MCGIAGVYSFNSDARRMESSLNKAIEALSLRGPDMSGKHLTDAVALGHARLSILDISEAGSQPMTDPTGRYTIVFNGEIYNFHELRNGLESKGYSFTSDSDTEALLYLYIEEGAACLDKLNGFFAFAVYDEQDKSLFIARDRIGIKPLLYYVDEEYFFFGSEMKALMPFPIKKDIDTTSLYNYLQLNYIPGPDTIFNGVKKLEPGCWLHIKADKSVDKQRYYQISRDYKKGDGNLSYEAAQSKLTDLLDESIRKRMIADVPLGAFLSGGIDSSVIVALASRHTDQLNTFSIGYKDEPFFDETQYAELVARKFKTNHTTFSLSNNDLYEHLFDILDYIDEPFADSSAIAVYILSKQTRSKVTVALSGDGADEMFSGYNKHLAHYKAQKGSLINQLVKLGGPAWGLFPQSRNSKAGDLFRKLDRFSQGLKLSPEERYWRWCSFVEEEEAKGVLANAPETAEYLKRKATVLQYFEQPEDLQDCLYTDMHLVLQNDMLTKVDLMSMANSLEVRVPFLDHEVVDFAFQIPEEYKIGGGFRKRILKDAFRNTLPEELYTRPKHGFEVPLLKWFRGDLKGLIVDDLLEPNFIREQGIFNPEAIEALKQQLFSNSPGEVHAQIWGMIVFQYWWKKYLA